MATIPAMPTLDDPLLGFRFAVSFLGTTGIDHPKDFRFQQVSGIGYQLEVGKIGEGNQQVVSRSFPQNLVPGELELVRGMPLNSTYREELLDSFNDFQFKPRSVLVSILNEIASPISSWVFTEAYPVSWEISGLDADANQVLVENMKLTYYQLKPLSL